MSKRYYKVELLIEDSFDDNDEELGNGEMATSEIAEFLTSSLPYGFKIVKKVVIKIAEGEFKNGESGSSN